MKKLMPLLVLLSTIAFLVAPAVTTPFRGYAPDQFPVFIERSAIQPASYAFSIWGVIYLWLLISAGFGLWARPQATAWHAYRWPLIAAVSLGAGWLAIANAAPILATVVIYAMLITSVWAFLVAPRVTDRWLLSAPLGLFAGWLTAASSVSLGVILNGYGVLADPITAFAMLVLALTIGITVQVRCPSMPTYGFSVAWAAIGIAVINWQEVEMVAYAAVVGAVVMAAASTLLFARNRTPQT